MKLFDIFTEVMPIKKGWSEDKKYRVMKPDGTKYLLRIMSAGQYKKGKAQYEVLQRAAALDIDQFNINFYIEVE